MDNFTLVSNDIATAVRAMKVAESILPVLIKHKGRRMGKRLCDDIKALDGIKGAAVSSYNYGYLKVYYDVPNAPASAYSKREEYTLYLGAEAKEVTDAYIERVAADINSYDKKAAILTEQLMSLDSATV